MKYKLLSLILCLSVTALKAQNTKDGEAVIFYNSIIAQYNTVMDATFDLTLAYIHSDPQTIKAGIAKTKVTLTKAIQQIAAFETKNFESYEHLKRMTLQAMNDIRLFLDNLKPGSGTATSRELLARIQEQDQYDQEVSKFDKAFQKTLFAFSKDNGFIIRDKDEKDILRDSVARILNFSRAIDKLYLQSKIPLEDFISALNASDTLKMQESMKEMRKIVRANIQSLEKIKKIQPTPRSPVENLKELLIDLDEFAGRPSGVILHYYRLFAKTTEISETLWLEYQSSLALYNDNLRLKLSDFYNLLIAYEQEYTPLPGF